MQRNRQTKRKQKKYFKALVKEGDEIKQGQVLTIAAGQIQCGKALLTLNK